jgi:hypothetical protein
MFAYISWIPELIQCDVIHILPPLLIEEKRGDISSHEPIFDDNSLVIALIQLTFFDASTLQLDDIPRNLLVKFNANSCVSFVVSLTISCNVFVVSCAKVLVFSMKRSIFDTLNLHLLKQLTLYVLTIKKRVNY